MSNDIAVNKPSTLKEHIGVIKNRFIEIANDSGYKGGYEKESYFAMQIMLKNDYLKGIAQKNVTSLQGAILNCATIGVTLNPAMKLAYLIPRGNEVIYELSYRGLIYLAIRDGGIRSAIAEVVKEDDDFLFKGKFEYPHHAYNPFAEGRENLKTIGAYCVARLPDGSVMTEVMSRAEIDKVKNCSTMKDKTVWRTWSDEMDKKSVSKRGSKMWPACPSLATAIQFLNEENGEGFTQPEKVNKAALINQSLHDVDKSSGEIHNYEEENNNDNDNSDI